LIDLSQIKLLNFQVINRDRKFLKTSFKMFAWMFIINSFRNKVCPLQYQFLFIGF